MFGVCKVHTLGLQCARNKPFHCGITHHKLLSHWDQTQNVGCLEDPSQGLMTTRQMALPLSHLLGAHPQNAFIFHYTYVTLSLL